MPRTGRPSILTPNIIEDIAAKLSAGAYFDAAVVTSGASKVTAYRWIRLGVELTNKLDAGTITPNDLNEHEQRCVDFRNAIDEANESWDLGTDLLLERLSRGEAKREIVTEKRNANGDLIERTVRTEQQPIDVNAIIKRKRFKFPQRYKSVRAVELSGEDGDPLRVVVSIDERAAALLESVRAVREQSEMGSPTQPD